METSAARNRAGKPVIYMVEKCDMTTIKDLSQTSEVRGTQTHLRGWWRCGTWVGDPACCWPGGHAVGLCWAPVAGPGEIASRRPAPHLSPSPRPGPAGWGRGPGRAPEGGGPGERKLGAPPPAWPALKGKPQPGEEKWHSVRVRLSGRQGLGSGQRGLRQKMSEKVTKQCVRRLKMPVGVHCKMGF